MSDFILDYDILEAIAKNSNLLGKRSEEYADQLESKIINAIEIVTGPSSGYLTGASDSVRDKINALKLKSEAFHHFAEQILNLLEVAEQVDQEVADAIAAGREYFLEHHESLRIDDWKAKLLGLYVELKNSMPLLGTIADLLGGLDALYESLKDYIKHWYECEGGKYIVDIIKAYAGYEFAVGLLALSVLALSLPVAAVFAVCGIIAASIGVVNATTNIVTSYRAAFAAIDENPAWAMIYGKQNSLSDVLRQTNFGNGVFNDLSNLSAGAIDITETVCAIVGLAEAGVGVAKLFKGEAFQLLINKGALNLSDLKSGVKNGILDLKSSIKQGYKDFKSSLKGVENVEDVPSSAIKGGSNALKSNLDNIGDDILEIMEDEGGHTLDRHVGKSKEYLVERAEKLKGKGATTYSDKTAATNAVKDTISQHKDEIIDWLMNSNNQRLVLKTEHSFSVGNGVKKGTDVLIEGLNKTNMVIEKCDNELGFRIITSYPVFE